MNVTCEQFRDRILELAYGELDSSTATGLRDHADRCSACRDELHRIERTRQLAAMLPEEVIPTHFDADILQLAARTAETAAAKTNRTAAEPGIAGRLLPFILQPRIAALSLAAAVLVGLVWTVNHRSPREAMFGPGGAPFEGAVIREVETPSRNEAPDITASPVQKAGADLRDADPTLPMLPRGRRFSPPRSDRPQPSESIPVPSPVTTDAAGATNPVDDLIYDAEPSVSAKKALMPPPSTARAKSTASGGGSTLPLASAADASPAPTMEMAEQESPQTPLGEAISLYRAGNCRDAVPLFQSIVTGGPIAERPASLHYMARCDRRSGRCGQALLLYEQLLRDYRAYPDRSEALHEAASCHRRLGHDDRARELLMELSDDPDWSARARAEMAEIAP